MSCYEEIETLGAQYEHDARVVEFIRARMDALDPAGDAFCLAAELLAASEQKLLENRLRLDHLLKERAAEAVPRGAEGPLMQASQH